MEQIIKAHKKLNEATIQLERAIKEGKLLNIDRDIILTKIAKAYDSIKQYCATQPLAEPVIFTSPKVETPAKVKPEVKVEPIAPKQDETKNSKELFETPMAEPKAAHQNEIAVEVATQPKPILPTKPIESTKAPEKQQKLSAPDEPLAKNKAKLNKLGTENKNSTEILSDKYQGNQKLINERIGEHSSRLDVATKLQNRPISDLSKAIGINDKFLYIKELFNGNAENYTNTLKALNQFTDLNDAIIYIHQNFEWSNDNESATRFIDLVRRKFI